MALRLEIVRSPRAPAERPAGTRLGRCCPPQRQAPRSAEPRSIWLVPATFNLAVLRGRSCRVPPRRRAAANSGTALSVHLGPPARWAGVCRPGHPPVRLAYGGDAIAENLSVSAEVTFHPVHLPRPVSPPRSARSVVAWPCPWLAAPVVIWAHRPGASTRDMGRPRRAETGILDEAGHARAQVASPRPCRACRAAKPVRSAISSAFPRQCS